MPPGGPARARQARGGRGRVSAAGSCRRRDGPVTGAQRHNPSGCRPVSPRAPLSAAASRAGDPGPVAHRVGGHGVIAQPSAILDAEPELPGLPASPCGRRASTARPLALDARLATGQRAFPQDLLVLPSRQPTATTTWTPREPVAISTVERAVHAAIAESARGVAHEPNSLASDGSRSHPIRSGRRGVDARRRPAGDAVRFRTSERRRLLTTAR